VQLLQLLLALEGQQAGALGDHALLLLPQPLTPLLLGVHKQLLLAAPAAFFVPHELRLRGIH